MGCQGPVAGLAGCAGYGGTNTGGRNWRFEVGFRVEGRRGGSRKNEPVGAGGLRPRSAARVGFHICFQRDAVLRQLVEDLVVVEEAATEARS